MLNFEAHDHLALLVGAVHRAVDAAAERAPVAEVELRVEEALGQAERLEQLIGQDFIGLRRHLSFLRYWHKQGKPASADGDIVDLRERDLPDAITAVLAWSASDLNPALVAAIEESWGAGRFDAAVREAFILLEAEMRRIVGIPSSDGITGRVLVNRLLPQDSSSDRWASDGLLGALTTSEQRAGRELLLGALALFRNATAHRPVAYSRAEAEDVLHLVNLGLRLLAKVSVADKGPSASS